MLEIEGDRVIVTDRSGSIDDLTVRDAPDDSYHSSWFGKMAEDFQRAIAARAGSPVAARNLLEARTALGLILAARESALQGGAPIQLPA